MPPVSPAPLPPCPPREAAGYEAGTDFKIAIDAAASELYCEEDGMYHFEGEGKLKDEEVLTPIFFSLLRKRKRAVHGPKEKAAWTRSGAVTLRAQRGLAYRCLLRFGLAFGHAMLFCDSCCCRPVADGADLVGVVVISG